MRCPHLLGLLPRLQAFLDMRQLMLHLEDILRQCRALCTLVQRLAEGATELEAAAKALRAIGRAFQLKQRVLYQIMQSGKMGSRAPALRQLITRLNFNNFAERQARPMGAGPPAAGAALAAHPLPASPSAVD